MRHVLASKGRGGVWWGVCAWAGPGPQGASSSCGGGRVSLHAGRVAGVVWVGCGRGRGAVYSIRLQDDDGPGIRRQRRTPGSRSGTSILPSCSSTRQDEQQQPHSQQQGRALRHAKAAGGPSATGVKQQQQGAGRLPQQRPQLRTTQQLLLGAARQAAATDAAAADGGAAAPAKGEQGL